MMIARIWRGRIRAADADEYRDYMLGTGTLDYQRTPGNRGAYILTRTEGNIAHVTTLSFWESSESIRAFAGEDISKARYYPEDRRFLLDFPEHVEHFEVAAPPAPAIV